MEPDVFNFVAAHHLDRARCPVEKREDNDGVEEERREGDSAEKVGGDECPADDVTGIYGDLNKIHARHNVNTEKRRTWWRRG